MGGRGRGRTSKQRGGGRGKKGSSSQTRLDELLKPRRSARQASYLKAEAGNVQVSKEKNVVITLEPTTSEKKKTVERKVSDVLPKSKRLTASELKKKSAAELEKEKKIEEEDILLLKEFDLNPLYGPCRGITRSARYLRAIKFCLNPQPSRRIQDVLDKYKDNPSYQDCIWDQYHLLKTRF